MEHLGISHLIHKQTEDIYICCRCGQHPLLTRTVVHLNGGKRTITKLVFSDPKERVLSKEDRLSKIGLVLPEELR